MTNLIEKYCNLGKEYFIEKDYTSADFQYQKALSLDPNSLKALLGLASVKFAEKKYQAAKQLCYKSIKINPNQYKVYYTFGIIENQQGRKLQAKQYFEKTLQINHKFPKVYINLGYIQLRGSNLTKSQAYYLKASQLDQNNLKAYLGLGLVYQKMMKYEQALKYLIRALNIKQDSQTIHLRLGIVYHQMDNIQKAKQHYRRCIQLDKFEVGKALYNLGVIQITKEQNYGEGLDYIEKAIQKQNNNILYLMSKVKLLYRFEYDEQANKCLDVIRKIIKNLSMVQIKRIYGINEQVVNWIIFSSKQLKNGKNKEALMKQKIAIVGVLDELQPEQLIKVQRDQIILQNRRQNSSDERCQLQKQLGFQIKYLRLIKENKLTQYSEYFNFLFFSIFYTFSTLKLINSDMTKPHRFVESYSKDINDKLLKLFKMDKQKSNKLIEQMFNGVLIISVLRYKSGHTFNETIKQLISKIQNQNQLIKFVDETLQFILNTKQLINQIQNCNQKQQRLKIIHLCKKLNQAKLQKQQYEDRIKAVEILSNLAKNDMNNHIRMGINHCLSIIMVFIKAQNEEVIKQFYNPLFATCLIWIKQLQNTIILQK